MPKVRRNDPCPCGSAKKAKRCCHGPVTYIDVRMLPVDMTQGAVDVLRHTSEIEMRAAFDQLVYLPEVDLSLQVPLSAIVTPDVEKALSALRDNDDEEFDRVLQPVVASLDSVDRRVELARSVVALWDQGRIPETLAAVAIMELDREESILFKSAVAESLAVLAGDQRTPSGLLIASR